MSEDGFDIAGVGKLAKAIPEKSWNKVVATACETFEKCLAPITETTGGIGRLISAKFDRLVEAEKILAAETFRNARKKVEKSKATPQGNYKSSVIVKVLEQSSQETDMNMRELWENLLAQELMDGSVHPEVVSILSRIAPQDAQTLAKIAEESPTGEYVSSFVNSFAKGASIGMAGLSFTIKKRPQFTFSEKLLESLNLIELDNNKWVLTAIGEGFIASVSEPV
jgi:Abortive infection alpha